MVFFICRLLANLRRHPKRHVWADERKRSLKYSLIKNECWRLMNRRFYHCAILSVVNHFFYTPPNSLQLRMYRIVCINISFWFGESSANQIALERFYHALKSCATDNFTIESPWANLIKFGMLCDFAFLVTLINSAIYLVDLSVSLTGVWE